MILLLVLDTLVGLQVSSDSDTQQTRIDAGAQLGRARLGIVADLPLSSDGSDDVDAVVEFAPGKGTWAILGGWRASAIAIEQGRQWQQQLLVGATGTLPSFARIEPSFGIEFAATIVRHGDGLETDWISLASQRHVLDTVSTTLFLRLDYVL